MSDAPYEVGDRCTILVEYLSDNRTRWQECTVTKIERACSSRWSVLLTPDAGSRNTPGRVYVREDGMIWNGADVLRRIP